MKISFSSLCALPVLVLAVACGDTDPNPIATVASFAPETLDPSDDTADDLTIRVDYADGDGDLGEGIAEVYDCRVSNLVLRFDLPKIASEEAVAEGVPIEGSLDIVVADVSDLTPDSSVPPTCAELGVSAMSAGQAVFCVLLVDVAGNSGDGDCTGTVAIE